MDSALMNDIDRVSGLSKQGHYDFLIVGSGLAGGVLARQLIGNDKKVLLIEKGGLEFSTHCLNTSRPHWQIGSTEGPSQDNDAVYAAVKQKVHTAAGSDPYAGGPVYNLGGRSNMWGLYSPALAERKHRKYFPSEISDYLEKGGYRKAFGLFINESQDYVKNVYPQNDIAVTEMSDAETNLNEAMEQFYKNWMPTTKSFPKVSLSPMAAEFKSSELYNFPQGAYSTVDFLLDRTYARDANLTILLNTEVLTFPIDTDKDIPSVIVRSSSNSGIYRLFANKIILCAGTLGTAAIALNSGLQKSVPLVGKGLTDHEIWGIRFLQKKKSDDIISKNGHLVHQNAAADDNDNDEHDTINITIETHTDLSQVNEVLNTPTSDPTVYIKHEVKNQKSYANKQTEMQDLATQIRNKLLIISCTDPSSPLSRAGFGAVAHEVGTMRMQGPKTKGKGEYVIDKNLELQGGGGLNGIYVCDLSIFPFSPPANPSLTLAAIAMWLGDRLVQG
ncbi:uncharacterized protein KY384_000858, partial [Bacidia gigantensis]|uniref:uncharacterized protein n=1 Tax=Bacidia gigantensis TaxID=2732470 RepID=UPI001D03CAE1